MTNAFRGIRFATAARLQPPVDVEWTSDPTPDHTASAFGAQAPQQGGVLEQLLGADDLEMSEDCLFLNVFTPSTDDRRRPVLMWIHGGAYVTGTGAMPWYDGAPLASRGDVVVVTINYRLGAFGFLGDRNLGSLDQIAALRWVQRHIADFGGDPDNVTIFGESAGGSSVVALTSAPEARDLFSAVWAMSPSLLQLRSSEEGAELETEYLGLLGTDTTGVLDADTDAMLDAQSKMRGSAGLKDFAPTGDTVVFPGDILDAAALDDRPMVIGTNIDEMLLFTAFDASRATWGDDDINREFTARFASEAPAAIAAYRTARPGTNASQLVSAMQTDEVFRQPAQALAEQRDANGNQTWMYQFDEQSTAFGGLLGSCHGLDIPFAFHTLDAQGAAMFTGDSPRRVSVADHFADALIGFARDRTTGWPPFDVARRSTQRIGPDPEVVDDPEAELRSFWTRRP